jgi:hypothetical protein
MTPPTKKAGTKTPAKAPDARAAAKAEKRGRARVRMEFLASRAGTFNPSQLSRAMAARLATASSASPSPVAEAPLAKSGGLFAKGFATTDASRWVPIGPSVVRRGQAEGRPRVSGRIRDLAVEPRAGARAYAASAKGGVWYTDDAGASWAPVGGWAAREANRGGSNNAQTCGCILVHFGATAADDYVMVGTGERVPSPTSPNVPIQGGVGILAARGPTGAALTVSPWEDDAGLTPLEGLGIFRLARAPGAVPGQDTGAGADRVMAATSAGVFMGTRGIIEGPPPDRIERIGWTWTKLAGLNNLPGLQLNILPDPVVTDALWLPSGAPQGRMIVALASGGVAYSDDAGANWTWVTNLDPSAVGAVRPLGRLSLSTPGGDRVYVLGELPGVGTAPATPTLWKILAATTAVNPRPVATSTPGLPSQVQLWAAGNLVQRDYDQALAVVTDGAVDHIYVGGSAIKPTNNAHAEWSASLWCFDTPVPPPVPPPAAPTLVPSPGISDQGGPPHAGADRPGLIGNNVHADVHVIRTVGAGPQGQVWVGCDGGVFVSAAGGCCNTFLSRAAGLAVLEVGFVASHPTSSHLVVTGCQDAGALMRQGDTVWEMIMAGDGGGTIFHPIHSQYVISQLNRARWRSVPGAGYIDPISRRTGGRFAGLADVREFKDAAFYSGAAAATLTATTGRIAIGTNRVWISDDLGGAGNNHWAVIGFPDGAAGDARPHGGTDPPDRQPLGVPKSRRLRAGLGNVIQLRWSNARDLLALYASGLVRYLQNPVSGAWTAHVLIPDYWALPAATVLTDVCPVPGSSDFYLTTTGDGSVPPGDTCWFFNSALFVPVPVPAVPGAAPPVPAVIPNLFTPTGLRAALNTATGAPGPLDPAYAVAVDPANPTDVYVGTVTGVWRSQRTAGTGNHSAWAPFVNGLPQTTVQDLGFWTDPAAAAGSPRLLRAALQSRGVWEVDLSVASEPKRTYARVHLRDDRRRLPTPMANPRLAPTAPPDPVFASPDLTIRPAANRTIMPRWQPGTGTISAANPVRYQLWTFQTAFRWLYPSIVATGLWTDQMGDLVRLHRSVLRLAAGRSINRALWDAVVGETHVDAAGNVTRVAADVPTADPLAVYRAPWQSRLSPAALASEVDQLELVTPVSEAGGVWRVYAQPSTVDVMIHHRDMQPLAANDAFAVLMWRSAPDQASLLATTAAGLAAYVQSLATAAPMADPVGWQVVPVPGVPGGRLHRLNAVLDARMPRAVSIDVDFSAVTGGHRVLLLAFVGSSADAFSVAPVGAPATVGDLVRAWPYACMRLVWMMGNPP